MGLNQIIIRNKVQLCNSCTRYNAGTEETEKFRQQVQQSLRAQRPDFDWQVESSTCLRVCPIGRITLTVSSSKKPEDVHMALSQDGTVESVVAEVLTFFRPLETD